MINLVPKKQIGYPYFKCYLCKLFNRRKYNKCVLTVVRSNKLLCYSTFFSIWKWFVRFALFTLAILFIYFNIRYVWHYTVDFIIQLSMYNKYECTGFEAFCAAIGWIELLVLGALIFWTIFNVIYRFHREFKNRGGKYW